MASAKQFLGNKAEGNDQVAVVIKTGSNLIIGDVEQKDVGGKDEPCLALKPKGMEIWVRINKPSLKRLIAKFGDNTDDWKGKKVICTHSRIDVFGKPNTQIDFAPA